MLSPSSFGKQPLIVSLRANVELGGIPSLREDKRLDDVLGRPAPSESRLRPHPVGSPADRYR